MPGVRFLNKNVQRFQDYISFRNIIKSNISFKSVFRKERLNFFKKETEKIDKGSTMIRTKRPYRALLILLVGKSHCAEAVENLKDMTFCLARLLTRQCKVHTSQKVHRSLHMYSCYSRMWGEELTRKMIFEMRRSLMITGKTFLMSAVLMIPYDWEKNKITDERIQSCIEEYETVDELCKATVCCEECFKRQVIDKNMPDVEYCTCKGKLGYIDKSRNFDSWEGFLERENILVWRRKHRVNQHLYSYKVYGTYNDTSLSAFMETQLNPSFRTQWDTSALELKILSSDSKSHSDLLYWLVKFPHFFANRDYVFKRRFHVNERKKEVIIVNEIAEHSGVPEVNGVHRVKEYWSIMVLRAKDSFNKPGMSYTLTYFDNPGTSLPSPVTNFVASTAFPDFLVKVHHAAISLQRRWENGEDVYVSLPAKLRYPRPLEEDVGLPVPETESVVVSSLEESDVKNAKEHSVIAALQNSEEDELVTDSKNGRKIPIGFRKVVIDLLEALEVTSPEYEGNLILTSKIEAAIDKLGLDKSSRKRLVEQLGTLRSKTKAFMTDAAKKKEESIKTMKEFERRRYYYEHSSPDEKTLVLIVGLLKAVNDVLKAENEMRIGKGLATPPEKRLPDDNSPPPKEKEEENRDKEKIPVPDKEVKSNVNNIDALAPTVAFCEHDSTNSGNGRVPASPWYSFAFVYSWWGTKSNDDAKDGERDLSDCKNVTEKQTVTVENSSSSNNNQSGSESQESRSWYHCLWFSPTNTSEDLTKHNIKNEKETGEGLAKCNSEEGKESVPWYFFPWLFRFWTRENV